MNTTLRTWEQTSDVLELRDMLEDTITAGKLAYVALTEGMQDVPSGDRDLKCARLRIAARRKLHRILGELGELPGRGWSE